MTVHTVAQFAGLASSPTRTNGAKYLGSAHCGCCAASIIASIDFCCAWAWESFGSAASEADNLLLVLATCRSAKESDQNL